MSVHRPASESTDRVFGWIAVQKGFLSPEQLETAQSTRRKDGYPFPLSDWLVSAGWLSETQRDEIERVVRHASSDQTVVDDGAPARSPTPPPLAITDSGQPPTAIGAGIHAGRLGKYDLVEEIGRGGMGVVYRAVDMELRREVALKTVLLGDKVRPEAIERLLREARTAGSLAHPGIVPIHDMGVIDGVPYFAMSFLRGRTLERVLKEGTLPGLRERAKLIAEVAQAVGHAHRNKVIHRDLKPSNIYLDEAGRTHVMDFGLAKNLDEGVRITATGQMIGTPQYMPPEQIDGDARRIGPASDVYSLGAVLYEALTGRPPFQGSTVAEIVGKSLQSDPESPRSKDRRIHADLETICLKALEKDSTRRYADANEFAADLERYLNGEAIEARPITMWMRICRRLARQKLLTGLVCVAVLVGAWAGGVAIERGELHRKVREDLRGRAGLYLETTLTLRREGLSLRRAGESYLKRLEEAVDEANRIDPGHAEPPYHLGRFHRALLRFDDALEAQDTALAADPEFGPSLYERAVLIAREHGRRLEVVRDKALQQIGARVAAGGIAPGERIEVPTDEELEREDAEARRLRARLLADLAALERVSRSARGFRRGASQGLLAEAALACAQGLALSYGGAPGERDRARDLLEGALGRDPLLEEAYEGLARIESAAGAWENAAAAFERGLRVDKGYLPFWIGRAKARVAGGALAMQRGEDPRTLFSGAMADYARALELDPGSVEALVGRGNVGLNWGLYKGGRGEDPGPMCAGAVADFGRALEIAPGQVNAWAGRGLTHANWGWFGANLGLDPVAHYRSSEADFGKAIQHDPEQAQAWTWRGVVRNNWGLWQMAHGEDPGATLQGAIADFSRSLELNPAWFETWKRRGLAHCNAGYDKSLRGISPEEDYRLGVADLDNAIRLNGADPDSRHWRGFVRMNWGQWLVRTGRDPREPLIAAEQDFNEAIAQNGSMAEAWMQRGATRECLALYGHQQGHDTDEVFRAAVADLDRALELNPTLARALHRRAIAKRNWAPQRMARGTPPQTLFEEVQADLDRAIEVNAQGYESWSARGSLRLLFATHLLSRGGNPGPLLAQAISDLTRALELNGRDPAVLVSRARACLAAGEFARSAADFERAVRLDPALEPIVRNEWESARTRAKAEEER